MRCPKCQAENLADSLFCEECGGALEAVCPACGADNRPRAKFCRKCRAPLSGAAHSPAGPGRGAADADAAVARKVVTIVFADLVGSTSLHERLDAESARRLMDRYYRTLRAAVDTHGGTVVKLLGDGVMAAFGVPRVAEDDAIRAVRAAVDMQRAFHQLAHEQAGAVGDIGLRVAVNTGEVVVSDDHTDVVGDPVNVAARLQQEAHDGDVLIGESTRRLISELVTLAPFGVLSLKGRSETVAAYRVVSLDRPASATATAFVGRDDELRRIVAVYDTAVTERRARLAVILGSPGLGKSRLLDEFTRRLGDGATVVTAHCDATGGATFAPLAEALRALLSIRRADPTDPTDRSDPSDWQSAIASALPGDAADRDRIITGIAALLAGSPASPEETFFVVRRFLAALAAAHPASPEASQGMRPVVLAIDDLQWAEPLLLDLTEHLVQWSTDVPLLVLAAARPELRDARSSLAAPGGLVADVVTLGGLDAAAATRLAANVIGADALPAAVAGRVLATSEGNPLFVGELVRMLVHDGVLKQEGDRWTIGVELAALEMPPTIHAVLAARIERLRPEERTVLERAAVVGRHFSRAAVAHLLPRETTDLDARLESLRRSEIIEPDTGWFLGEPVLRFHHVLIRDAAYRRLLKGTRAELHSRFADWLQTRVGDSVEHEETIGRHLEQAHQHLRELGPIDAQGRALGDRASRHLAAAGQRALARDDLPVAASLLGRALERLDTADPARADLALDWCEALLAAGDVGPAKRAIDELGRFIEDRGLGGYGVKGLGVKSDSSVTPNPLTPNPLRLRAWHTCFAGQLAVLTDPQALRATADAVAAAADELASAGDAAGEAKAHSVHATALARLGKIGASEAALDRALAAARRAHDRRRANAVLAGAPLAALWGPSPVTRASGRCLDVVRVLRITQGAPAVEAVALRCQGVLEALRGRTDAARRMIASSRRVVEELGITQRLLEADVFAGHIELLEGDAVAAERCLRGAYDGLREHGLGIDAAQAAALLGRALLAQGRAAEAEALSHESEALAGDDLKAAIAWRGVRAEALARRGEHASAIGHARAAVDIATATDALLDHADARLALAVALRAAGRDEDAGAEEVRAIELWEAKGATLLALRHSREGGNPSPPLDARLRGHDDRLQPSARPIRRLVRPNAATANAARMDAAFVARDTDAFPTLFADGATGVHHPTGAVYAEHEALGAYRVLGEASDATIVHEPLATLGDALALFRVSASFTALADNDVAPFGAVRIDEVVLAEVDPSGRRLRSEVFAADRMADAIARLYERHAGLLPDGPERARAVATARSAAALLGPPNLDSYAAAFAPDIEFADHRIGGFKPGHGRERLMRGFRGMFDLATDIAISVDEIFCLQSDAFLVRWRTSGTDRASGGKYEYDFLLLWTFGADGLSTHNEQFESDREDEALARFDELVSPVSPLAKGSATEGSLRRERRVRANAATANAARFEAAMVARDVDAITAHGAAGEALEHTTGAIYDQQAMLPTWLSLLRAQDGTYGTEPLATLGDSLALSRQWASASGIAGEKFDVGAYENEHILLIEVDAQGQLRRTEVFTTDRMSAAVTRLYERYAELLPDGPERTRAVVTARSVALLLGPVDLDRWGAAIVPALDFADHRRIGLESSRGAEAWLSGLRSLHELAEDLTNRVDDVLSLRSDALLVRWTNFGRDRGSGGAYERHFLWLGVFGRDGLMTRIELFEVERDAEALARFDELSFEPTMAARIENAATRSAARLQNAWDARDWDRFSAVFAKGFRSIDKRRMIQLELDLDEHRESLRANFEMASSRHATEVVATRGDRLALIRIRWEGADSVVGPSEVELLAVIEVDGRGDQVAMVVFDPDDLDVAYAELDARYAAGEAADSRRGALTRAFTQAFAARDWDTLAALLAPDLVVNDHRLLGWETLHGPAAYVQALKSLVDLAPDVRLRVDHVTMSSARFLYVTTWLGTREGGAFESPSAILCELDGTGRIRRFDQYDLDQIDEARARFEALGASAYPDPLRIPPNAATLAMDRWEECAAVGDWDGLRALFAPALVYDDRRRIFRITGDRDMAVANVQLVARSGTRASRTLLATAGDGLALERALFSNSHERPTPSTEPWAGFESETLQIVEVDAEGRIIAAIAFDPDDRRAAGVEMFERHSRSDAGRWMPPKGVEFRRALAAHDLGRLRAVLPDDFFFHDHRRTGAGRIEGADAYVAWLGALFEQSPDAIIEPLYYVATEPHGFLAIGHTIGTNASGGEFESVFVQLAVNRGDRPVGAELFEIQDLDLARARFEELRPDPARIPPNAATRVRDRYAEGIAARNWPALRALVSDDFTFEDRSKRALLSGDVELWIATLQVISSHPDGQFERELISALGARIAVDRVVWTGGPDGSPAEVVSIRVIEVDANGRLWALTNFDLDDRRAAFAEAYERFAAGEAASIGGQAPISAFFRAYAARDWDGVRGCLTDDLVLHDRRMLGLGSLGRDEWIAALRMQADLAPDVFAEKVRILACNHRGCVDVHRLTGTMPDGGGPFEKVYVCIMLTGGDRIQRVEFFDVGDADQALARFEELSAEPPPGAR